jgi:hypothetical protein
MPEIMEAPQIVVPMGHVRISTGVTSKIPANVVSNAVVNHARGKWGLCCPASKEANDDALANGNDRILSVWRYQDIKFWVLTEEDRQTTRVILPEEY